MASRKPRPARRRKPQKSALVPAAVVAARPGAVEERKRVDALLRRRVRAMRNVADLEGLLDYARPMVWFVPGRSITVADKMQSRYTYELTAPAGEDFAPGFRPAVSPGDMLARGVFEGRYCNDCVLELPREWFASAILAGRLDPAGPDAELNEFGAKSRKSLGYWRKKGWIPIVPGDPDVRGWFQWYCRYWIGRRDPAVDDVQIARWKSFVARHGGQIRAAEKALGKRAPKSRADKRAHRPRQRQGLLQWAANPYAG
jgi:hypothetical protein